MCVNSWHCSVCSTIGLYTMDYDKKFQEDLEKAAALSLETLALDQFRRNKLLYSASTETKNSNNDIKSTACKYFRIQTDIAFNEIKKKTNMQQQQNS